jgi:MFS family permease
MQMGGMLLGGLLWGILGDKRGRLSVLFGSIALYSLANILNAFVSSVGMYGFLRFLAGVGLAGELGAAVTLVTEVMSSESRGYGTTIVASVGFLGAVVAGIVTELTTWKVAYLVGGGLGIALLLARIKIGESALFQAMKNVELKKGDLRMLLRPWKRLRKYLACICVGLPCWFTLGILISFSPEFGKFFRLSAEISAGRAIALFYIGLVLGDLLCGLISQWLHSRIKALLGFIVINLFFVGVYLFVPLGTDTHLYGVAFALGLSNGSWAVFVTNAAEQFGTNLRATVTTTVPNFVRGAVVPITLSFQALKGPFGLVGGALTVGILCSSLALISALSLEEPFGKNLQYWER